MNISDVFRHRLLWENFRFATIFIKILSIIIFKFYSEITRWLKFSRIGHVKLAANTISSSCIKHSKKNSMIKLQKSSSTLSITSNVINGRKFAKPRPQCSYLERGRIATSRFLEILQSLSAFFSEALAASRHNSLGKKIARN